MRTLYLVGRLKAGTLKIEVKEFVDGADRTVILHARLNDLKFHQTMFSQNYGREYFAQFTEDGHSHRTTLVASETDDIKIGRLILWHDRESPESFRIDIDHFLKAHNLQESILDGKAASLNLLGGRKAPPFTPDEIERVFGSKPSLLRFMRRKRPPSHTIKHSASFLGAALQGDPQTALWECELLLYVPSAELMHLMWEPIVLT
jgi:hypothetical protein